MEKCSLRELLAKASPLRSGDVLAGFIVTIMTARRDLDIGNDVQV